MPPEDQNEQTNEEYYKGLRDYHEKITGEYGKTPTLRFTLEESFIHRIKKMNETFKLPSNDTPTSPLVSRITDFHRVLSEEVDELLEARDQETQLDSLTILADTLGDIVVYVFSEARRCGIPLLDVLHIIMDSQDSKLVDGQPLMSDDGSKFIKGPNYEAPEPKIRALLKGLS